MTRRKRFEIDLGFPDIRITAGDLEIFKHLDRHDLLDNRQVAALVGRPPKKIVERMNALWQKRYVGRPNAQKVGLIDSSGSQVYYHGLANRGRLELGLSKRRYKETGFQHQRHTLLVSEIVVAIELACRERKNIDLVDFAEILVASPEETQASKKPMRLPFDRENGRRHQVPDSIFALYFGGDREGEGATCAKYFFLEADRGTEPVRRRARRARQLSFIADKIEGYSKIHADDVHRDRFDIDHFRVLFVTDRGWERVENMVYTAREKAPYPRLFLFTNTEELLRRGDPLSASWCDGYGKIVRLDDVD